MYEVVGIKFASANRLYYFEINSLPLKKGDKVIVETEKGIQFGSVSTEIKNIEEKDVSTPLKKVLRIATKEDLKQNQKNEELNKKAIEDAKKISNKLDLKMNFIGAYFTLDRNQLIYNFVSDERVDFRELAKRLASIYKTRIELRQIGVRDKAKEIGGLGPCGRFLCCNSFLTDFNSVSINMAKNQYIALNPTKINGICGRLLCCLNFEDDQYTEMKKSFPEIGVHMKKGNISGKVVSHNLFKRTYTLECTDKTLVEFVLDEDESN
ncbi:MAG: stage 0 sporulation protein [Bacilli bacterium]|nr:stage 0 sporulation protein [Bacilli bacterium]